MMTSRRQVLIGAAALGLLPASAAAARTPGMDAALDATFAASGAPALAGMVVGPDGPLWMGARGVRRAGEAEAVSVDDLWHLGSNTKAMTAALFGRLVDQGLAQWEARLSDLLPDLAMDPAWRGVPIEALMGHVAGLSEDTGMGRSWLLAARADPRDLPRQRGALVKAMLAVPPAGTPGTFAYTNSNYVLLGAIIERLTGLAWEDAMRSEVFAALGITTGGFGAPTGNQPRGHRGGVAIDPASPGSDNPLALGPAGTVHMSLADYGRFLRVFLTEGGGWITSATRTVLTTAIGDGSPPYAGGWIVATGQTWARGPALTHDGSNTMWYASTWIAPGLGRAFVAVSNDAAGGRPSCQRLIPGLIRAI